MNYQKTDELVQALINDSITFETVKRRLEIAKSALVRLSAECPNTFNYLCRSDVEYNLCNALEALDDTAYKFNLEGKARFLDTPESQPPIRIRRITWKTKLENFFISCTYGSLLATAIMASSGTCQE
ncbi:hypothetical protein B4U84_28470 [Westiellopsis prolifica IICB1]|nr:hypothetical protein B4U84_28470 [Westiellopsis prolifica IICB1]